jgi:hypothetical protein
MYTISSAVLRQQRKSDVMTCFGRSAHSAVYYQAGSPLSKCKLLQQIIIFTLKRVISNNLGTMTYLSIIDVDAGNIWLKTA